MGGVGSLCHGESTEYRVRKLGSGLPVCRLGDLEGCSPSLGTDILICKTRASETFLPKSVVLGHAQLWQGDLSPWDVDWGHNVPQGGKIWQIRAVKHLAQGLAQSRGLRNISFLPFTAWHSWETSSLPSPSALLEIPAGERRAQVGHTAQGCVPRRGQEPYHSLTQGPGASPSHTSIPLKW